MRWRAALASPGAGGAGYSDGAIRMFDLRANCLRWEASLPTGVCGVQASGRGGPAGRSATWMQYCSCISITDGIVLSLLPSRLQFDRRDIPMNKFTAACMDSWLHVFDARTQHPKLGFAKLSKKVCASRVDALLDSVAAFLLAFHEEK